MAVERLIVDLSDVHNSQIAYDGFAESILKMYGQDTTQKLLYNKVIDDVLNQPNVKAGSELKAINNKRTVVQDFMENPESYKNLPMILKNAVVNLYYKNKEKYARQINLSYIKSVSGKTSGDIRLPLIANLLYHNFKHDPNPQVFVMYYDPVHQWVEGFNLKYLTLPELRKLIKLSIKYPEVDMRYFYHQILKPYSVAKAMKMKVKDVRRHFGLAKSETDIAKIMKTSYHPYPKKGNKTVWNSIHNYHGQDDKIDARYRFGKDSLGNQLDKAGEKVIGFGKVNNMLDAYRKYKITHCHFYNVPVEFFQSETEEEGE